MYALAYHKTSRNLWQCISFSWHDLSTKSSITESRLPRSSATTLEVQSTERFVELHAATYIFQTEGKLKDPAK